MVHRIFKSSNILLDEEYSPHLSDCGLAALSPNPEREVNNVALSVNGNSFRSVIFSFFFLAATWAKKILLCYAGMPRFPLKWLALVDIAPLSSPCQEYTLQRAMCTVLEW